MKLHVLTLAAASTMMLTACGDDEPTQPTPTNDSYLNTTEGQYYVMNVDTTTGTAENPTVESSTVDSVVVAAALTYQGKPASMRIRFNNGNVVDSMYQYEEGGKVYEAFQLAVPSVAGLEPINLGSRWIVAADQNATTWQALYDSIPNLSFSYSGTPLTGSVAIRVTGTKVGAENVTIGTSNVSAVRYDLTYTISLYTVINIGPAPQPITIVYPYTISSWWAKGHGVVRTSQAPGNVSTPFGAVPLKGRTRATVRTNATLN
ncbi:MAG TPA: hypothetical protein DIS79_06195 [Bacteroidetes bacterium]|nr:hypothetical protein [Bacteroidota bacterium]HRK03765.1 hypothetical protein [Chlorobiota bacterium]